MRTPLQNRSMADALKTLAIILAIFAALCLIFMYFAKGTPPAESIWAAAIAAVGAGASGSIRKIYMDRYYKARERENENPPSE